MTGLRSKKIAEIAICAIPWLFAAFVWLSALGFVPVPWPDDSAFYFVGRDLFHWPPRWVMIPQAPFEPTYRIFNFNTMPLYPVLIGLGRLIGIDGSFGLKIWPLSAWAACGSALGLVLLRVGLPWLATLFLVIAYASDPELRWSSVLIRPESLVTLCGILIVLGLSFGFPKKIRSVSIEPRGLWDPISALLALAAYTHFNAVHLLFPVVAAQLEKPKRLIRIALLTALYLTPWMGAIAWHPHLFVHQMSVQWERLAVASQWLQSAKSALDGIFDSMGSPEPWPAELRQTGYVLWALIFAAVPALVYDLVGKVIRTQKGRVRLFGCGSPSPSGSPDLRASAAWVLGAVWLAHQKPEVWFMHFVHASCLTFLAILTVRAHRAFLRHPTGRTLAVRALLTAAALFLAVTFVETDVRQESILRAQDSWSWEHYDRFVDCVDRRLTELERRSPRAAGQPFQVWCPTFPDITVELARRHPGWELTRTNDFWSRQDLAIAHGHNVDAVVVTEIWGHPGETYDGPTAAKPNLQSVWMNWEGYWLKRLYGEPGWDPIRYTCEESRWTAFLYMHR